MVRGEVARPVEQVTIDPHPPGVPAPLAPSQNQIWVHAQMAPSVPVYNEAIAIRRRGPIDRVVLQRCFQEILRRHEILRTTFSAANEQVMQVAHDDCEFAIPYADLTAIPENRRASAGADLATADAQPPFDPSVAPLMRLRLVKLGEDDYRIYLTFNHLIFDGMAINILLVELSALYDAFCKGQPSPLPEPRLQYADYALWQRRRLAGDSAARQLAYWRQALEGAPSDSLLPADRPRPAVPTFRGGMETFAFPEGMLDAVRRLARQEDVTIYMLLLACFHVLLYRYSGAEDLIVGAVTDGRDRADLENLMGSFTNIVVLRTKPRGHLTFREFLAQVKEVVLRALENADLPFDAIVRELHPKRSASRNPFYQVMFSIGPPPLKAQYPAWEVEQVGTDPGASKCDLYFMLDESLTGMVGRFNYSSDLFDQGTIRNMVGHWLTLVDSAVRDPGAKLSDLSIMSTAETRVLVHDRNDTAREIPAVTVHELIEKQVAASPESVAVEAGGVCLTYHELNRRANRLARRLRSAGVTADTLVALFLDRTVDLVIAPLAVLKAGGAYVPLDPEFPRERLAYMIEDSQSPILLSSKSLASQLPSARSQVVYCDDASDVADASNLAPVAAPESLAYVRYTSGSTGRPKGVQIQHRSLVNFLRSMQREPGFSETDVLLAITTHSFDISELELNLPLISGGRVAIATREDARDPRRLIECLLSSKCTVLQATPASWRSLIDLGWGGQAGLKALCGGEALSRELAELLLPRVGELWNLFGPTETTVWSTVQRVAPDTGPVPIGRPIDNTQVYLLDAYQKLVPTGAPGELCIAGAGVALGYLRQEELTNRFLPNPYRPGERVYRTGDLARWRPDGTLDYLGRIDNQVKIRGFRIELGEIESVLGRHPFVRQCAVVVREDSGGDRTLVAYVVPNEQAPSGGDFDAAALRSHLKREVPDYMVPAGFLRIDRLPLTPNGKIDRKALPAPTELRVKTDYAFEPPRDELEQSLAQIWSRVLKVKYVGRNDDFFELGGHSLAAVQTLVKVQQITGRQLPLAVFFQASTLAGLADVVRKEITLQNDGRRKAASSSWSSLVPIQPSGSKRPLFLVHGAEGNVLLYRQLTRHLKADQPVYGLQSQGLSGDGPLDSTIEEMAEHYVREIVAVQPQGPYALGGYCLGGVIAYEIAQQLIAAGKQAEIVIMLDTYNPSTVRRAKKFLQAPRHLAQNVWFHGANALMIPASERGKFLSEKVDIAFTRAAIRMNALYHAVAKRGEGRYPHLLLKKINDQAAERYQPSSYAGRVAVIRAKAFFSGLTNLSLGWDECVEQGLEVHELPIYPKGMLIEPLCRLLADTINRLLEPTRTPSNAASQ